VNPQVSVSLRQTAFTGTRGLTDKIVAFSGVRGALFSVFGWLAQPDRSALDQEHPLSGRALMENSVTSLEPSSQRRVVQFLALLGREILEYP
jgi:hypothetical protein